MQIIYEDEVIDVKKGTRVDELLQKEIVLNKNNTIACRFNNEVKPLNYEIETDGKIELIDMTNKDGMKIYRKGLIYIVSMAFKEVYHEALLTVNFQLSNSILCEVQNNQRPISDERRNPRQRNQSDCFHGRDARRDERGGSFAPCGRGKSRSCENFAAGCAARLQDYELREIQIRAGEARKGKSQKSENRGIQGNLPFHDHRRGRSEH